LISAGALRGQDRAADSDGDSDEESDDGTMSRMFNDAERSARLPARWWNTKTMVMVGDAGSPVPRTSSDDNQVPLLVAAVAMLPRDAAAESELAFASNKALQDLSDDCEKAVLSFSRTSKTVWTGHGRFVAGSSGSLVLSVPASADGKDFGWDGADELIEGFVAQVAESLDVSADRVEATQAIVYAEKDALPRVHHASKACQSSSCAKTKALWETSLAIPCEENPFVPEVGLCAVAVLVRFELMS